MTNSLIPYSFVPGTKAKAQEVNANFIALAEQIQTNNTNLTNQITELETTLSEEIGEINENSLVNNFYTIKGILPADLDYIVEKYKAGNAFYLLYKSVWIRQGGYLVDSIANYYYPKASGVNPSVTRLSTASTTSSIPIWIRDSAAGSYMKIYSSSSTSKFWVVEGYISNPEEV